MQKIGENTYYLSLPIYINRERERESWGEINIQSDGKSQAFYSPLKTNMNQQD